MTMLERLVAELRARGAGIDGQVAPAAILWTDPSGEWRGMLETLLAQIPELLVLGDYAPDRRTGPSIWLRCVIDRVLDEPALPADRPPIVYLPGVGRQELRAGEACPAELRPLVELQYRGILWHQPNGCDWTVRAFLTSPRALGLDVARDQATTEALLRALPELAVVPLSQLEGRRLQASDFDRLLSDDVVRDLLRWMADPEVIRERMPQARWEAFCSGCRDQFGFDPQVEADVTAGERLGRADGPWISVWERFAEAPTSYPGIPELLRRSRPFTMPFDRERWPHLNEKDEDRVRREMTGLPELSHAEACERIERLEEQHGERRKWVWARLGESPMARVLEPLARLAGAAKKSLGGATPGEMAEEYLGRGWQVDAAAWQALAEASGGDAPIVGKVVRHLLEPWLEESARAFQAALERAPLQPPTENVVEASEDECLVFVDGLRFDLGQRLAEKLEGRGCRASVGWRWAATPTVTATAKPAVTPLAREFAGATLGEDFAPIFSPIGRPVDASFLRKTLEQRGYQILDPKALVPPRSRAAQGWLETGDVDSLGHKFPGRLADFLDEELSRLVEQVLGLLEAGWQSVRVVTDHGWLLLPGGLPKVDLPKHLTESRWARCAVIRGESTPDVPRAPWSWNRGQWFATAPGIACFNKQDEYAHGGLSLEECLIPDLRIQRVEGETPRARITAIKWHRLRCFVDAEVSKKRVIADLRLEHPNGPSVAAKPKDVDPDGSVSLVLESDEHEDADLYLVLLDDSGTILTQRATRVGADP